MENNIEDLRNNLLAFFELFKDKPNMMISYLLEYEILTEKSKRFFTGNDQLRNFEYDKKPFFRNFDEMKDYYDKFFINNGKIIKKIKINRSLDKDILNNELENAILVEDYERAAKIQKILNS